MDFPWVAWIIAGATVWMLGGMMSGFDLEDRHERSIGMARLVFGGVIKLVGSLIAFVGLVRLAKWAWG